MPELTKNRCSLSSKQSSTLTNCTSVFLYSYFQFEIDNLKKKKERTEEVQKKEKKRNSFNLIFKTSQTETLTKTYANKEAKIFQEREGKGGFEATQTQTQTPTQSSPVK